MAWLPSVLFGHIGKGLCHGIAPLSLTHSCHSSLFAGLYLCLDRILENQWILFCADVDLVIALVSETEISSGTHERIRLNGV